jgi:hypothetical protein
MRVTGLTLIVLPLVVVTYRRSIGIAAMIELLLLRLWLLLLGGISSHACFLGQQSFVFSLLVSLRLCAVQL